METDFILLISCTILKIIALLLLASFLIAKWKRQDKKYLTDFPFLMSLTFYMYAVGKVIDIFLYFLFKDTPNLAKLKNFDVGYQVFLSKLRFIISPVIVVAPYFLLMMIIWFRKRRKLQIILGSSWFLISILVILLAQTYSQLLIINALVAFPPIILSIFTFAIIHRQKRMPEINSLFLVIGWSTYVVVQLIRPIWINLGSGNWGLSWLGELIEMVTLIIIGIGFMIEAFYKDKIKPV